MANRIEDFHELRIMRVCWQGLTRRWALTGPELSMLLPEAGWDQPMPPGDTERRMRLMLSVDYRLPFRLNTVETCSWARTPIEEFSFCTPIQVMAEGAVQIRALRDFLEWKFS